MEVSSPLVGFLFTVRSSLAPYFLKLNAAIDNCDWIDNKAGLCKSELIDMLGVEEKISVIDPTSMAAFSLKKYGTKDDLTVNRNPIKGEDTSTINSKDQEGKSLAEHT